MTKSLRKSLKRDRGKSPRSNGRAIPHFCPLPLDIGKSANTMAYAGALYGEDEDEAKGLAEAMLCAAYVGARPTIRKDREYYLPYLEAIGSAARQVGATTPVVVGGNAAATLRIASSAVGGSAEADCDRPCLPLEAWTFYSPQPKRVARALVEAGGGVAAEKHSTESEHVRKARVGARESFAGRIFEVKVDSRTLAVVVRLDISRVISPVAVLAAEPIPIPTLGFELMVEAPSSRLAVVCGELADPSAASDWPALAADAAALSRLVRKNELPNVTMTGGEEQPVDYEYAYEYELEDSDSDSDSHSEVEVDGGCGCADDDDDEFISVLRFLPAGFEGGREAERRKKKKKRRVDKPKQKTKRIHKPGDLTQAGQEAADGLLLSLLESTKDGLPARVLVGPRAVGEVGGRLQWVATGPLESEARAAESAAARLRLGGGRKRAPPRVETDEVGLGHPGDPDLRRLNVRVAPAGRPRGELVAEVFSAGSYSLIPFRWEDVELTDGSTIPVAVGTGYVLARFFLVDAWTLRVLRELGALSGTIVKGGVERALSRAVKALEDDKRRKPEDRLPAESGRYAGSWEDPNLRVKRARVRVQKAGRKYFPPPIYPS